MSWYCRLVNAGEMGLSVYPVFEVKRASLAITGECKFSLKARACFEYFSKYRIPLMNNQGNVHCVKYLTQKNSAFY